MKRRFAELLLVAAGVACLSQAGWSLYRYARFQRQAAAGNVSAQSFPGGKNTEKNSADRPLLGQLRIPRLGMSVAMVEGDDEDALSLAAGHMAGTVPIGRVGNAVIAGHRDTVFWPLRQIRTGDAVIVSTDKKYIYTVERTQIVDPENENALRETSDATLTMITCYPFRHVGPAPKRFIVTAKLLRTQS